MTFDDRLARVIELLQRQGWVSYRTPWRRFHLDDETITALKGELMETRRLVVEEVRLLLRRWE